MRLLSTQRAFADGYGRAGSSRGFESHLLRSPSHSPLHLDSKVPLVCSSLQMTAERGNCCVSCHLSLSLRLMLKVISPEQEGFFLDSRSSLVCDKTLSQSVLRSNAVICRRHERDILVTPSPASARIWHCGVSHKMVF